MIHLQNFFVKVEGKSLNKSIQDELEDIEKKYGAIEVIMVERVNGFINLEFKFKTVNGVIKYMEEIMKGKDF